MGRRVSVCAVLLCAAVVVLGAQNGPRDDEQYQAAQRLQEVNGDYRAAIKAFAAIASRPGVDRGLQARALLGMADSHRLLKDPEATRLYRRVQEEFSDQRDVVQAAAARLTAIQASTALASSAPDQVLPQFAARLQWTPGDDLHPTAISADGRWMAVDRGFGAEVLVRNMVTGELWSISPDADPPALSRDGRLVAYNFFGRDHLSAPVPDIKDAGGLRVT